jgi:probable rRNA maturation factor|tara:strand:+ start:31193 stop:31636 length:444 start_codon:yes stop_codon:yes gene_type:complete
MSAVPEISVYNHQSVVDIASSLLTRLKTSAQRAIPKVLAVAKINDSALTQLDEVEISLVDDPTIADVHMRFMDVAGATDVITFDHGELHISVETAQSQACEFGNDFERELMLYVVHGLLHLAGHEDASAEGRATMDELQQRLLNEVW